MISVIICSLNKSLLDNIKKNIAETIGVDFEIIAFDNNISNRSIFKVYNQGQQDARFELLVYVHEDVLFHTPKWGNILVDYFDETSDLGCVGVAGSFYKTKAPSAWWEVEESCKTLYLKQHLNDGEIIQFDTGWSEATTNEVVIIDGVFMATKKSHNLQFDESLQGFHCYDLNISIESKLRGLKNIATREILIEHLSLGTLNKSWVVATAAVHQKYKHILPLTLKPGKVINPAVEIINQKKYFDLALKFNLHSLAASSLHQLFISSPLSQHNYIYLRKLFRSCLKVLLK